MRVIGESGRVNRTVHDDEWRRTNPFDRLQGLQFDTVTEVGAEWHADHGRVPARQNLLRSAVGEHLFVAIEQRHISSKDGRTANYVGARRAKRATPCRRAPRTHGDSERYRNHGARRQYAAQTGRSKPYCDETIIRRSFAAVLRIAGMLRVRQVFIRSGHRAGSSPYRRRAPRRRSRRERASSSALSS